MMEKAKQLFATAKIWFHASDIVMNVHLDASYLLEAGACSRACGHFFIGWSPVEGAPI
jgi:hypothetical protein